LHFFEGQPEADASRGLVTRGLAARELARDDASRIFWQVFGFFFLVTTLGFGNYAIAGLTRAGRIEKPAHGSQQQKFSTAKPLKMQHTP
jgi:hypothetical protein